MEQLRSELALVLGTEIGRLETISEQAQSRLFALYDNDGKPMPLVAKYFRQQGRAALEAKKLTMLGHEGAIAVPAVLGLVLSQQQPVHEMLLLTRFSGVSAEAPARTAERGQQLCEQIVEGLLAWHRIDSQGMVGSVDSVQENTWPAWYRQRVEVLWSMLGYLSPSFFTLDDRQILFRSRQQLTRLFADFDAPCVLLHGDLRLASMVKDAHSDRLIAMMQPGNILWAPREYELMRLAHSGAEASLLQHYLQRAPVADGFLWRRWLYQLWDCVDTLVSGGPFDRPRFDYACQQLLPWLG